MRTTTRKRWTVADIPDQAGRIAVITGASSGIGYETARALAARHATVVLACRDDRKAQAAAARIAGEVPGAKLEVLALDLASLASVQDAAREFRARHDQLDLLINNAGVMWAPYAPTADGFEVHVGTNHLGHYALTGWLLERLTTTPGSRVVTVSSNAHRLRRVMGFEDLRSPAGYQPMAAYARSKLANLLFCYELQRRLAEAGLDTASLAAHPGAARTDLTRHSPAFVRVVASPKLHHVVSWLIQDADRGALPTLRAATDPAARGGEYYGPDGRNQWTGSPTRVDSSPRSHDVHEQQLLWTQSEQLTGVRYELPLPRMGPTAR